MNKNISDIVSIDNKIQSKNISKFGGYCASKYDYSSGGLVLFLCSGCKIIVCGRCTNNKKNKCTMCKSNYFPENKCKNCNHNMQYFMCHYCENILRVCSRCFVFDDYYSAKNISFNDIFLVCEKCQ